MDCIRKKLEFVYFIGGRYYIIGSNAFEECESSDLIQLYKEYLSATSSEDFRNKHVYSISPFIRNNVATLYLKIFKKCVRPLNIYTIEQELRNDRDKFISIHEDELYKQVEIWELARDCYFYSQIENSN
mgnify:CR=1 FL=1